MHEKNSFITLTYADEHLKSPKLQYSDFQKFMKKLRKTQAEPIGVFVTGEYGEDKKRPHWHAILFGFEPSDLKPKRKNERGDQIYSSESLDSLWGKGSTETGAVTLHSANYCARYAAKKLSHGKDSEHDFHPISRKSSKHAIGKKWLEKNWKDVFGKDGLILPDFGAAAIPRYYEKWLAQNHPLEFVKYVTNHKRKKIFRANARAEKERADFIKLIEKRSFEKGVSAPFPLTRNEVKKKIGIKNFKKLQEYLKL